VRAAGDIGQSRNQEPNKSEIVGRRADYGGGVRRRV